MSKDKRVSLQDKEEASFQGINADFDETDQLAIDPSLAQELKKKNLAHRWINAKKWKDNYGFDPRRWTPYKRESMMSPGYEAFGMVDPEGYTRRGDLILAAQTQAIAEARRTKIANKNKVLAGEHNKSAAASLRESLKGKAKVSEGYEDNE